MLSMSFPWQDPAFRGWLIVGMNHYHVKGERRLFVAMVKDGRCIQEEGPDDEYLWNRLWHKAMKLESVEVLTKISAFILCFGGMWISRGSLEIETSEAQSLKSHK
jgi:hypothetical protein